MAVDWNNLTVADVPPGDVEGDEAAAARENISATLGKAKRPAPPPDKSKPRQGKIAKNLSKLYGTVGATVYPFDQQCGQTILENADRMADSLEALANENAAVKRVLEKLAETSAWGTVFAAHAPVLLAVSMHHGPALAARRSRSVDAGVTEREQPSDTESNAGGVGEYIPPRDLSENGHV